MSDYKSYVKKAGDVYMRDVFEKIPGVEVTKVDIQPSLILNGGLLHCFVYFTFEQKSYCGTVNAMTWKVKGCDNPYMFVSWFSSSELEEESSHTGKIIINPITREVDARDLGIELEDEDEFYRQLGVWHQHFVSAKDDEPNLDPSPLDVILTYEQNTRASRANVATE